MEILPESKVIKYEDAPCGSLLILAGVNLQGPVINLGDDNFVVLECPVPRLEHASYEGLLVLNLTKCYKISFAHDYEILREYSGQVYDAGTLLLDKDGTPHLVVKQRFDLVIANLATGKLSKLGINPKKMIAVTEWSIVAVDTTKEPESLYCFPPAVKAPPPIVPPVSI